MKEFLLSPTKKRQYLLVIGDILIICTSIALSYAIRFHFIYEDPSLKHWISRFHPFFYYIVGVHLFTLYLLDQYNLNRLFNSVRTVTFVILSIWSAGGIIGFSLFFFPKYIVGRQVFLFYMCIASALMVFWRLTAFVFLIKKARPKRLLVVGTGSIVTQFINELSRTKNSGFIIGDVVISDEEDKPLSTSLMERLSQGEYDILAFDSTNGHYNNDEIRSMLEVKHRGKGVYALATLYKNMTGKIPLSYIDGRYLLDNDQLQGIINLPYMKAKRFFDMFFSSVLLIFCAPVMFLIAIAIRLDSRGSTLFVQERLGLHQNPFRCLKFRTMIEDAEKISGPTWSSGNDPRVTRVGRFLRLTRLDELPQLINIVQGHMSFVGPRPIRAHFAHILGQQIPFYALRFSVKPGLSGWAQANFGYGGSEEGQLEKFQYELFYIENMSLFLDIWTILKTIRLVFLVKGRSY